MSTICGDSNCLLCRENNYVYYMWRKELCLLYVEKVIMSTMWKK